MEEYKNKVKENFLKRINKIQYKYKIEDIVKTHMKEIEEVIDIIIDTSKNMPYLTEQATFIIRKRLGVYDNGISQILHDTGKLMKLSYEMIRKIEEKAYINIITLISKKSYVPVDNNDRMSSMTNEVYKDYPICDLEIGDRYRWKINVTTLYNLLSYSSLELKRMGIGETFLKKISDQIHSIGLKYIDELTDEEKKTIIKNMPIETINNSSTAWINSIKYVTKTEDNLTIGMLNKYEINKEAINYATNIGINITSKELSYDELLDTNIEDIEMPIHLFNILKKI